MCIQDYSTLLYVCVCERDLRFVTLDGGILYMIGVKARPRAVAWFAEIKNHSFTV